MCILIVAKNVFDSGLEIFRFLGCQLPDELCNLLGTVRHISTVGYFLLCAEWHVFAYLYIYVSAKGAWGTDKCFDTILNYVGLEKFWKAE